MSNDYSTASKKVMGRVISSFGHDRGKMGALKSVAAFDGGVTDALGDPYPVATQT